MPSLPQSRWWLATLLAPLAWYVGVGNRFEGFVQQPDLVLARTPEAFRNLVFDVGGAEAVRSGVLVDLVFAALLVSALGLTVAGLGGRWLVVLPALVLDLAEGALLWQLTGGQALTSGAVGLLFGVAIAKLLAYAGVVVAVALAQRRMRDEALP